MTIRKDVIGLSYGDIQIIGELEPHVTPNGSRQRVVLCRCSCGHEFECRLTTAKTGKCPNCKSKSRRKDITGQRFGKLVVLSMADDYVSPSGHRLSRCKCKCDCGNECITNMSQLVTGSTKSCGCLLNTRGLLKDNKEAMAKYDYELNSNVDLSRITTATNRKIWWKCKKCHRSWLAAVSSQTSQDKTHGCPYCSGLFVVKGKTDLLTVKPELVKEWDWEKNIIAPDEISGHSNRKVYWKCSVCGHSWVQTVANRTNGSGCPKCNLENVNSFCEQAVYYYIKKVFPDAINGDSHIGMELDIYIPSRQVAIEYDGEIWHTAEQKTTIDNRKNQLCVENGIELIRIREPKLCSIDNCYVFVRDDSTTTYSLTRVIIEVLDYLAPNCPVDVNVDRDTSLILEQFSNKKYNNSLAFCYPEIAAEWHPTKNGLLTPDKVNKSSRYKVWWLGKCGHEWQMVIGDRTRKPYYDKRNNKTHKGQGCPYCSGKRVLSGFNDMESQFPNIAAEWHPSKNGDLKPSDVLPGSNKKVWWLCENGHEWMASPNKRCILKRNCPVCWNDKRSPKVRCVETGCVFSNASEAAAWAGIKVPRSIYHCCRHETHTAGGYRWEYVEDV